MAVGALHPRESKLQCVRTHGWKLRPGQDSKRPTPARIARVKPRRCFTDRGPGLYNSLTGEIVEAHHAALTRHGFRAFAGADGTAQPADLADFFLHETVLAWVRKWFRKHPFKAAENVGTNYNLCLERLQECEDHINQHCEVDRLCHGAVKRLAKLRDMKGARMKT